MNIYRIIIKDYGNKKMGIIKYFDFNNYIQEYIKKICKENINQLTKNMNKLKINKKQNFKLYDKCRCCGLKMEPSIKEKYCNNCFNKQYNYFFNPLKYDILFL